MTIDLPHHACRIGTRTLSETETISLDGNTGAIYAGTLPIVTQRPDRELSIIETWRSSKAA